MKKNYVNGFMGEGLDRKKRYGVGGVGESFLQPAVKKKEEEEYSPELKEFFKTGDMSVLQKSIAQTVLKDRIAQDKKDNEGINRLSVWGKYNQPEEKASGKVKEKADVGVYDYKVKDKEVEVKGAYPYEGKKGVEQWKEKKKPTPQFGQESWWEESEKKEEKPFKAIEHWRDENRGANKGKGYVDGFGEDKGNKQKSYFEDILEAESKRDKERGEKVGDSMLPIKDVVPSEVKLTQEEWDGLEDFEKEWTIEGTHRQMANDRKAKVEKNHELSSLKGVDSNISKLEGGRLYQSNNSPQKSIDPFILNKWSSENKNRSKEELNRILDNQYKWAGKYVEDSNAKIDGIGNVPWYGNVKNIVSGMADNRMNRAFEAIDENKQFIEAASIRFNIPKEIIASIILKEQYTVLLPDSLAIPTTYIGKEAGKIAERLGMQKDADTEKERSLIGRITNKLFGEHSTGLGAIFPNTGREAWENTNGEYGNVLLLDENFELQKKLARDPEYNINTIGAVLVDKAKQLGYTDLDSLSDDEWKKIVSRYNGLAEYGEKVSQYLPEMEKYLR